MVCSAVCFEVSLTLKKVQGFVWFTGSERERRYFLRCGENSFQEIEKSAWFSCYLVPSEWLGFHAIWFQCLVFIPASILVHLWVAFGRTGVGRGCGCFGRPTQLCLGYRVSSRAFFGCFLEHLRDGWQPMMTPRVVPTNSRQKLEMATAPEPMLSKVLLELLYERITRLRWEKSINSMPISQGCSCYRGPPTVEFYSAPKSWRYLEDHGRKVWGFLGFETYSKRVWRCSRDTLNLRLRGHVSQLGQWAWFRFECFLIYIIYGEFLRDWFVDYEILDPEV